MWDVVSAQLIRLFKSYGLRPLTRSLGRVGPEARAWRKAGCGSPWRHRTWPKSLIDFLEREATTQAIAGKRASPSAGSWRPCGSRRCTSSASSASVGGGKRFRSTARDFPLHADDTGDVSGGLSWRNDRDSNPR